MVEHDRSSLWYKDAIIYELHVKAFCDSSGDGKGDFRGLVEKLDYIRDLGVTAIWLLPFYPSPQRDDGYDIADYRGVHPDFGTLKDFRLFVREAHRRDLKVITELVVNHTSDQHPWFQAARRASRSSAKRAMYVWSDTDRKFPETRIIFTDTEHSNWTWDPEAGAYYWHRFFHHQPDLNLNNPRVVREVIKVLRYWLSIGVDGLRLDAIPYLCVREGTTNENLPETHEVIKQLRKAVDERFDERMLLAEANQWPEDVRQFFGDGDECHMAFHFPLMPRIFMSLSKEDREPIIDILSKTPEIPESCQWALFLRNHDELTLEMVTDEERDYMYEEYAKDERMRLNLGIRRRLAPLLDNDRRRIELLNSLLFSFPGAPVLYYGDEIGMGDNIWLGDRDGVRTPMQWSIDRNAGFSKADPARLYLPVLMDPIYGYNALNVEAQERDVSSLLHFMRRIIALRRQHKAFGRGTIEFLLPHNRRMLVYLRRYRGEVILCVANLSRTVQPVELDLSAFDGWTPLEMMGHTTFPRIGDLPYFLTLSPYGFYWFRLEPAAEPIHISRRVEARRRELPTIRLEETADDLFEPAFRYTLANDVVGAFLPEQRWFRGKAREVSGVSVSDHFKMGARFFVVFAEVSYVDGGTETYVLPLKVVVGQAVERVAEELPNRLLARVVTREGEGLLCDALADRVSCASLVAAMADMRHFETVAGRAVSAFSLGAFGQPLRREVVGNQVRQLSAEQSNTSVIVDDAYVLKFFRRLEDGPNPDLEIGRFIAANTDFRNVAPLSGGMSCVGLTKQGATLAILQEHVPNEGDGWSWFLEGLHDVIESCRRNDEIPALPSDYLQEPASQDAASKPVERIAKLLEASRVLGRRTAELHLALAGSPRQSDFRPEPMTPSDLEALADELSRNAHQTLDLLDSSLRAMAPKLQAAAQRVRSIFSLLDPRFQCLPSLGSAGQRIRVHGDLHLGQVLVTGDDFVFVDFEGEPQRSLVERRRKSSPLKDVAGMLRSFHYATRCAQVEGAAESAELKSWLVALESRLAGGFLEAYKQTAGAAAFLPGHSDFSTLLDAFLLDKAFYELGYELNNRPDWVWIPLDGILAIAESIPETNEGG